MPRGARAIQVPGGHISISRENAEVVSVYMSGSPFAVLFRLNLTETTEFAEGLKWAASEEQHPDACRTCGSLTPTKGCACDPGEVEFYVFRRKGDDEPVVVGGPFETEQAALQRRDTVALGTSRFSNEYFVDDVRKEEG